MGTQITSRYASRVQHLIPFQSRPPSAVQRPASAVTPPSTQLVDCSVASLTPSTSLASHPFPSHTLDSLHISVGDSALYRNRTVAPHSIVGCRVARLLGLCLSASASASNASCCVPPFAGCCVASLVPSICWLLPVASLPLPSHTPPPLGGGGSRRLSSRAVAAKAETKTSTCHRHSDAKRKW